VIPRIPRFFLGAVLGMIPATRRVGQRCPWKRRAGENLASASWFSLVEARRVGEEDLAPLVLVRFPHGAGEGSGPQLAPLLSPCRTNVGPTDKHYT
jgi:hypothetical protein